jgi:polysaccharide export outer membrane protein
MKKNSTQFIIAVLTALVLLVQSCANPKKISYFNYVKDSASFKTPDSYSYANFDDPKITYNDILQISVQTIDPAGMTGNTMIGTDAAGNIASRGKNTALNTPGYMVNSDGEIELPLVGKIKIVGMTTKEAKNVIAKKAEVYYKNPVVNIRFVNFVITMLGEIGTPGQLSVSNERLTILEAIALAGDIPPTGNKENILLGRDENGQKKFVRVNLNSPEFYNSPYYFLKQNDIIYVQPTKDRAIGADARTGRAFTNVSFAFTILTLGITLYNIFK